MPKQTNTLQYETKVTFYHAVNSFFKGLENTLLLVMGAKFNFYEKELKN